MLFFECVVAAWFSDCIVLLDDWAVVSFSEDVLDAASFSFVLGVLAFET
nr:Uncharacterized protein A9P81_3344 [Leptospira interrogans serovar Copenhageni/Icterohaemorrhagiae]